MFKKLLLLFSGGTATAVIQFLRAILIARLIGIEDFGIASTFLVIAMVTQLLSNLGMQKLIVQAVDGDDPEFQAGLHGFQILRGFVSTLLLLAIAGPMARFLGNEELTWAYQMMALSPFLASFLHFDIQRLQRKMKYGPVLIANLAPRALSIPLVLPLYWIFGDFRVMLFTLLGVQAMRVIASHLVAERRFQLRFELSIMQRAFAFGWPMLLNGVLLALVIQGEKLLVGREMGMAVLAIFAMGTSLLQAPTAASMGALNQFFLPQISAVQNNDAEFQRMSMVTLQANLLVGICITLGVLAFGPPLVLLALGEEYLPVIPLLVFFAMVEITRASRAFTSLIALARGKTGNGLAANLPRVLSLPLSWYALIQGADLTQILFIALGAELCGWAIGMWLMHKRAGVALMPMMPNIGAFLLFLTALACIGLLRSNDGLWGAVPSSAWAALLSSAVLSLALMAPLWSYLRKREMISF
ncbi:MAG: oligosaccharide flippase family protein [Mangrovicoccus sp.]|nr:oligosaccharide flippase family protein [Mangrovicoccus sp.]